MRPVFLSFFTTLMVALPGPGPARAALPVPGRPAESSLRRLHPPVLDATTGELRVRFDGLPPVYRVTRLASPRRFVIDFDRASLVRAAAGRGPGHTRWLRSWSLDRALDGHAQLVVVLSTLAPQHLLSARRGRELVLEGTLFVPPSPRAVPTPRPEPRATPRSIARPVKPVMPLPDATPTRELRPEPAEVPAPTPEPTPSPEAAVTPDPCPTPVAGIETAPGPEPSATAAPFPTPMPAATAAPVPWTPVEWPAPRLTTELAWVDEHVAFEALSLNASAIPHLQLDWAPAWWGWRLPISIGAHSYQFASVDFPGVFHRRDVTTGAIALVRPFELGPLQLVSGFGWGGTWSRVTSNSGPPAPPAASQFSFSPVLDLRGWSLRQELVYSLGPDLSLALDLAWTPVEGVTVGLVGNMPRMTGYRVSPSLAFGPGKVHRVGLFWETHTGGDFPGDPQDVAQGFRTSRIGVSTSLGLGTLERPGEVR